MVGEAEGRRYRAFISYSHRDAAFGRRLHQRLEGYALPRRLVGGPGLAGPVPARLAPIFRDRDELPAAHDLTTEVRAALAASDTLVVVCSPAAAASPWVAREVELFRTLHPGRPILAALIEGEPADAFPAALRKEAEPVAADFRAERDGSRLALLKLVAGIAGVGLDQLVQRDAQRRLQRVTVVTAVALAAVVAMGVLTAFALSARAEAERQRAEAEGMIEFMLTDLRQKLKSVGRLEVMTTVNERALSYYARQNLSRLPPDSLERRARVLHAMGADDEALGDHEAALAKFREARRSTAALLALAPSDPARVFTHAQSEFWLGYYEYQQGRATEALPSFLAYKRLADRLIQLAPANPDYWHEAAYADGNLCSVALRPPRKIDVALKACSSALTEMEATATRSRPSQEIQTDLINRHAWLADAYKAAGRFEDARAERLREQTMLAQLRQSDPNNVDLLETGVALQRALALLDDHDGDRSSATARRKEALASLAQMIRLDPDNNEWRKQRLHLESELITHSDN